MINKSKLALHLAILATIAVGSWAAIVPSPGSENVTQLFTSASLVFKGRVTSVVMTDVLQSNEIEGTTATDHFQAAILVDRVFKGELLQNEMVYIKFERPKGTYCNVAPCISFGTGEYDLFFLTERNHGYELLDSYFGKFPVSRANAAAPATGMVGLEANLVAGLSDSDQRRLLTNIELLGAMQKVSSTDPLQLLMTVEDPVVKAAAMVALLRLHDYRYLSEARALMEITVDDTTLSILQDRMSLYIEEVRDLTTVSSLVYLASSRSDGLRQAAIHALREMSTKQAVPIFVAALDDPVQLIRYDAVLGLATVEKNWDLAPSVDTFERSESKYISAWKAWWAETGRGQQYAPAANLPRSGEVNH